MTHRNRIEQIAIIDDTKFFTFDNIGGAPTAIISFDRDDGIFVYTLGADPETIAVNFDVKDGELNFALSIPGGIYPLEASITPDEPGIDILGPWGHDNDVFLA